MSAEDAIRRAEKAQTSDKGWSAGIDDVNRNGNVAGSAGAHVYSSKDGSFTAGVGMSAQTNIQHGGKPSYGGGISMTKRF